MAQKTRTEETVDPEQVATFLRDLADQFETDAETLQVRVGNKNVDLSPGDEMDLEVEVTERSSWVGKSKESVSIDIGWDR